MTKPYRILIVEDEERWREDILREALEDQGYQVSTSDSYDSAILLLKRQDFDLIVVDVNLTGVSGNQDGIRVVERLAAEGDETPVMMISGSKTRDSARERLHKYSPVAFIDKTTFDIGEFTGLVSRALHAEARGDTR